MTTPATALRSRVTTFSKNAFKLGFFGANLSSGLSATRVPERWSATWDENLHLAKLADECGLDFHLPVGRWKGYGGATNFEGSGFESTAWACGLLAATKRITVFTTVHAPLVHPVFAAKQFVTADHIGHGRFGLNLVCGWNLNEFALFGVRQRDFEERYAQGAEWITAIKRLWSDTEPFDFSGKYFQLEKAEMEPKPFGATRPIIMNAATSATGQAFAAEHADMLFRGWHGPEENNADNARTLAAAAARGREVGIYTFGYIICRPTRKAALDYEHYVADENADWQAIDNVIGQQRDGHAGPIQANDEKFHQRRRHIALGYGGCPVVGSPDDVAAALVKLHQAHFAGFAFSFVNYIAEFALFRAEVLPRLERLGLRAPQ